VKLYGKLRAGDKVVLETGNLAFIMAKEMEQWVGCRVRVFDAHHLPIIYATDKKTDTEDALKPAHLAADRPDSRLPLVAVPGDEEMEKRKLVSLLEAIIHGKRNSGEKENLRIVIQIFTGRNNLKKYVRNREYVYCTCRPIHRILIQLKKHGQI
jgi:hypothetical protein